MLRIFDNMSKKSVTSIVKTGIEAEVADEVVVALKKDVPDQASGNENTLYSSNIRESGKVEKKTQTLIGNAATVLTNLFKVTGVVMVSRIYGIVTTQLGVNVTTVFLNVYDGTASVELTDGAGTVCSAAKVGSLLIKDAVVGTAITLKDSNVGFIHELATNNPKVAHPCEIGKKDGADTHIRSSYATTDTPTSGVIDWYCEWQAISADGLVEAA